VAGNGTGGAGGRRTRVSLNSGGGRIRAALPAGEDATVTVDINQEPMPGLTVRTGTVTFDPNTGTVTGGTVTAGVTIGDAVTMDNVQLNVGRGGSVSASITGAQLRVGDLLTGTIDLNISEEGITGTATLSTAQITLPGGLNLTEGSVTVSLDSAGNIHGSGSLTAAVDGVGSATINASVTNDKISGTASMTVEGGAITLGDAVTVNGADLNGAYNPDGSFEITGSVTASIRDWAQSTIEGSYRYPDNLWSGSGQIEQTQDAALGSVTLSNTVLTASVTDNVLEEVGVSGDFTTENFSGDVTGHYDATGEIISGDGNIELIAPMDLGEGVMLDEASGSLLVENNELKTLSGAGKVTAPFEGQPTFQADFTDLSVDVPTLKAGGTATLTTLRDIQMGDPAALGASITGGASATVSFEDNALTDFQSEIPFAVQVQGAEVGNGGASLQLEGDTVNTDANFALTTDLSLPEAGGPLTINNGASITARVAGSELSELALSNVGFGVSFEVPSASAPVNIDGTIEGSYSSDTGHVEGNASAMLSDTTDFNFENEVVSVAAGLAMTATVQESTLTEITMDNAQVAHSHAGQPLVSGTITNGVYNIPEDLINFSAMLGLDRELKVTDEDSGWSAAIEQGAQISVDVEGSELSRFGGDGIALRVDDSEGPLAIGAINGAEYDVEEEKISGILSVTTERDLSYPMGEGEGLLPPGYSITLDSGSSVEASVAENTVQEATVAMNLTLADDAEGALAAGTIVGTWIPAEDKLTGDINATTLADIALYENSGEGDGPEAWSINLLTSSNVGALLTENGLENGTLEAQLDAQKDGAPVATGSISGTYTVGDEIAGEANAAIDVTAEATLTTDMELIAEGEAGPCGVSMLGNGKTISANFNNEGLASASGSFALKAVKGDGAARLTVSGEYVAGEGVSGEATVAVEKPIVLGESGEYELLLEAGNGTVTIEGNAPVSLNGGATVIVKKSGADFARVEVNVENYDFESGELTGSGSGELLGEVELGPVGDYSFVVKPSTGISFALASNELTEALGNLLTEDKNGESAHAEITDEMTYTAA